MPKAKKKIPTVKLYGKEDLKSALEAVRDGSSIRQASQRFRVPRSTIHTKLSRKYPEDCRNGRPATLSSEIEESLVEWIVGCADRWQPIQKDQVLDSVQILCKLLNLQNNFTDGRPGDVWFRNFLARHPQISKRKPQSFSVARAEVTADDLKRWFRSVEMYFTEHNLLDIPPHRIFNTDESAFFLTPEDGPVLTRRGARVVPYLKNSLPKQCITVLFNVSATGQMAPPMAVHNLERISCDIANHNAKGWKMGISPNCGWMDGPLFYEYITNDFFPWLKEQCIEFPVILFLDGHASHVTLPLSEFCNKNGIVLVLLYPNATHLLQPLDTAFFHPLKVLYLKEVKKWRMRNITGVRFCPKHIAKVVSNALSRMNIESIAINGFRGCGLSPFDPSVVDKMSLLNPTHVGQKSSGIPSDQPEAVKEKDVLSNAPAADHEATTRNIERYVSPEVLQKFRECKGHVWNGSFENENLFNFWSEVTEALETATAAFTTVENNENSTSTSSSRDLNLPLDDLLDSDVLFTEDTVLLEHMRRHCENDSSESKILSLHDDNMDSGVFAADHTLMNDSTHTQTMILEPIENGPIITIAEAAEAHQDEPEAKPTFKLLKEHCFWPGELPKARKKKAKPNADVTVRTPYVVSSDEVIDAKKEKENLKKSNKEGVELRKILREERLKREAEEKILKKQSKMEAKLQKEKEKENKPKRVYKKKAQ
ncbi:hypothetical protein DMENIID0001_008620 [Sergentomyia squamirostris]